MNLHSQIMNIKVDIKLKEEYTDVDGSIESDWYSYKLGHRDARHAAAELSLKAEARIEELEEGLNKAKQLLLNTVNPFASKMTAQEIHTAILNFLQENK